MALKMGESRNLDLILTQSGVLHIKKDYWRNGIIYEISLTEKPEIKLGTVSISRCTQQGKEGAHSVTEKNLPGARNGDSIAGSLEFFEPFMSELAVYQKKESKSAAREIGQVTLEYICRDLRAEGFLWIYGYSERSPSSIKMLTGYTLEEDTSGVLGISETPIFMKPAKEASLHRYYGNLDSLLSPDRPAAQSRSRKGSRFSIADIPVREISPLAYQQHMQYKRIDLFDDELLYLARLPQEGERAAEVDFSSIFPRMKWPRTGDSKITMNEVFGELRKRGFTWAYAYTGDYDEELDDDFKYIDGMFGMFLFRLEPRMTYLANLQDPDWSEKYADKFLTNDERSYLLGIAQGRPNLNVGIVTLSDVFGKLHGSDISEIGTTLGIANDEVMPLLSARIADYCVRGDFQVSQQSAQEYLQKMQEVLHGTA